MINLNDKAFIHTSKGGSNKCIMIDKKTGSCLPNCVGYVYGRATLEIGKHNLPTCNAESWYNNAKGYEKGKTAKVNSICVWAKGKVGNSKDGAGHIAYVEKVNKDKSIVISESAYGGSKYYTEIIKYPYKKGSYTFLGFIYLETQKAKKEDSHIYHIVKSGETLSKIAKAYKTSVKKLVELNKIEDKNKIITGDKLIIK